MLEWAAADLGVPIPDMSEYTGDIISNAAKKLGMSAQEFTNMVAKESAARVLMKKRDNASIIGKLSTELQTSLNKEGSGERIAVGTKRR